MQGRDKDLNECYQDKWDYYDSLSLHHECSSSILLKELAWEQSDYDLEQV